MSLPFATIQRMVYKPYKRLGFFDQWNQTDLKRVQANLNSGKNQKVLMGQGVLSLLDNHILSAETVRSIGEVGLFTEECGELMDAIRKGLPLSLSEKKSKDDKSVGEECADLFIRLSCFCERVGISLEEEILKKHGYNMNRQHLHGKKA